MPLREVVVLPVRFSLGARAVQATTRSLSLAGVFIRSLSPPRPGARLAVRIYFTDTTPEDFVAVCEEAPAGSGEAGFWARFDLVSAEARRKIDKAVGNTSAPPPAARVTPPPPTGALVTPPPPVAKAPRPRTPAENRSTQRVAARLPVRFPSVAALRQEVSINVSAGGMFIQTAEPPALRELVLVSIELPGESAPLEVRAQVVHRITPAEARPGGMPAGVGVQFVEADDRFRETLDRYLASHR